MRCNVPAVCTSMLVATQSIVKCMLIRRPAGTGTSGDCNKACRKAVALIMLTGLRTRPDFDRKGHVTWTLTQSWV